MLQYVIDVFLPSGFPQSVTEDYVEYQIFVSLPFFFLLLFFLSLWGGVCVYVEGWGKDEERDGRVRERERKNGVFGIGNNGKHRIHFKPFRRRLQVCWLRGRCYKVRFLHFFPTLSCL